MELIIKLIMLYLLRLILFSRSGGVFHTEIYLLVSLLDFSGEVLGFENLVFGVFDFIHGLIETSKFRSTVKKSIGDLLYYVLLYMQMTEDQVS